MNSKTYISMIANEFGGLLKEELKNKLIKLVNLAKKEEMSKLTDLMDVWLGINELPIPMIEVVEGLLHRNNIEDPKPQKIRNCDFEDRTPQYIGLDARIMEVTGDTWYKRIRAEREAKRKAEQVKKLPEFTINKTLLKRYNHNVFCDQYTVCQNL